MRTCSVVPYSGDEGFIFISYSHKDRELIFPIIERMAQEGYRIWYDEGIDPGSEWPEFIANNLSNCSAFIAFISDNSLNSHNCRREITYAIHKQKPFVSIFLEDAKMTPGMEMQLTANQAIHKYSFEDEEKFYKKLFDTSAFAPCLGAPLDSTASPAEASEEEEDDKVAVAVPPVSEETKPKPEPKPTPAPKAKRRGGGSKASIICGVILVLAAVVFIICLFAGNESKDDNSNDTFSTASRTESEESKNQEIVKQAKAFIEEGKLQTAYSLLYSIKDDTAAMELLEKFTVVPSEERKTENYYESVKKHTYDNQGRLVSTNGDYYNEFYYYGSDGNLQIYEKKNASTDELLTQEFYSYKGDILIKKTTDRYIEEYITDSNGVLLEKSFKYLDSDTVQKWKYEYNSYGDVVKEGQYYDDELSDEMVYEYTYDEQGRKTTMTVDLSDSHETRFGIIEYTYTSKGLIAKEKAYTSGGSEYLETTKEYSYDENGNLIEMTEVQIENDEREEENTKYSNYLYFYNP